MIKNILSLSVFILLTNVLFAQNTLDAYKYVIVPDKFDAFKEVDKYQLNSLTKFLFEKYGFQTLSEKTAYPSEVINNPCLAVTAKFNDHSSMFTTKVNVDLIDCYNKVVFSTDIGKSKIKEYKLSYHEALRNTFISIKELNHSYDSSLSVKTSTEVKTVDPVKVASPVVSSTPIVESVPMVAVVPAKPVSPENHQDQELTTTKEVHNSIAKSYRNENISFMLIDQNNKMVAYVKSSNSKNYKNGEMIGSFTKTSLPNVYRVTWKNQDGKFEDTTGYIDDAGNLKVDINQNGKIEVVIFEVEK